MAAVIREHPVCSNDNYQINQFIHQKFFQVVEAGATDRTCSNAQTVYAFQSLGRTMDSTIVAMDRMREEPVGYA
jgi:hypothetical protein